MGILSGLFKQDQKAAAGLPVAAIALVASLLVLALAFAARAEAFIYWTVNGNSVGATGTIGRATLNGTGINPVFVAPKPGKAVFDVAVNDTHVYWTGQTVDVGKTIARAKLNGTGIENNLFGAFTFDPQPNDIAVDDSHVYWTYDFAPGNQGGIGRANLDGTGVDPGFITTAGEVDHVAISNSQVYWSSTFRGGIGPNFRAIGRANLDGTGVNPTWISPMYLPYPPELVVDDSHLYWLNGVDGMVGRANLAGTGVNQSFIAGVSAAGQAQGLAADAGHLYWLSPDPGMVGRANLDGTGVNQSFSKIAGAGQTSRDVAVDGLSPVVAGKVKANPNQVVKAILVKFKVSAEEQLTVKAGGVIKVNPKYKLKPRTTEVAAGQTKTLKLKPKKKVQANKIASALDAGDKATAKLTVKLTGLAGNSTTDKLRVKLKG